jgi:hypothetical protein
MCYFLCKSINLNARVLRIVPVDLVKWAGPQSHGNLLGRRVDRSGTHQR